MNCRGQLHKKRVSLLLVFAFIAALVTSTGYAFDAKKNFKRKCSSCHSIGGGDLVGPDLKGVTGRRSEEWLVKFIQNSTALVESGDEQAVALFEKYNKMVMPAQKFTADEIKQLLKFIDGDNAESEPVKPVRTADGASEEDVAKGKALFTGNSRLSKGGPQCLSCHSAGNAGAMGGGELGPDLTQIYSKLGDAGFTGALSNIAFPTMVGPYNGKELTEDEIFYLKAFFASVVNVEDESKSNFALKFAFIGLVGFVILLGIFHLLWSNRRTKTRRPKF